MTAQAERRSNPWLLAARPRTLPAAVAPIIAAVALAFYHGFFNATLAVLALLCALGLQIMVNLANDLFDAERGIDGADRLGPTRVTQSGLISPANMRRALWLTLLFCLLTGLPLVYVGGWPLTLAGMASILAALAYSAGPWPLANHGLGEVAVLIFFGLVAVIGCYWLQSAHWHIASLWVGLMVGLPCCAILMVNNIRDIESDRRSGKRTLAVRFGRTWANRLYRAALFSPFVLSIVAASLGHLPALLVLAMVPSLFWAWRLDQQVRQFQGRELNALLARTALYELRVSLLIAIALLGLGLF
ncbi:1,4-dihydroxy-2-naphthoate polyprenyltransferase [Saccharospirillum mangrovi]|uniref:1,4-dihydroxy-2-naphthoate polyprenyltransferase n=1 Tax=Saccharospirillum mangrovi TaxID=2161747 RepID=UPI000D3585A5|nr:1,4-dihydroxy-2-naphthoate polyprenyltransferase [Saccharospirillum mangrovi]